MQSFMGSLNDYSRFIEDFALYASVLYELREADFHEICHLSSEDVGWNMTVSANTKNITVVVIQNNAPILGAIQI